MDQNENALKRKMLLKKDYETASRLLCELIEADTHDKEEINLYVQQYGFDSFFQNLHLFDFSYDITDKVNAVRMVLYGTMAESPSTTQKFNLHGGNVSYEKDI